VTQRSWFVELDHAHTSYALLATLAATALLGWVMYRIGLLGRAIGIAFVLIRGSIRYGFLIWERLFAWATWPVFLALVFVLLVPGALAARTFPPLTFLCSLVLLLAGVSSCLAYMFIDLERYEVKRGYKAVHNPLKGQELAMYLPLYGHQVGVPLLLAAVVATLGGFALLNQFLYETIGTTWYIVGAGQDKADFADFLAYGLINLYGIVDVLNLARSHALLRFSYVQQAAWPASLLMIAFRSFFTLVLLQQIFASLRQSRLLAETIADFWSPHEPIHERARNALPEYGAVVLEPLLVSLRNLPSLTREQHAGLPVVLASIGPSAIPALERHLQDAHEGVRGIAALALGHLHSLDSIGLLALLARDPDERVRENLMEALGILGAAARNPTALHRMKSRRWRVRGLVELVRRKKRSAHVPSNPLGLLVSTLADALRDSSAAVRGRVAAALEQVGPAAASVTAALIDRLKDSDETVRCRAAAALGQVGSEEESVRAALIDLLQEASANVRAAGAQALGAMKKKAAGAVDALAALLHDREESVRQAAAESIAQVGVVNDTTTLVAGLKSTDNLVRARTAEVLGTIGPAVQDAAGALAKAIDDKNDRVRAKAVEAIGKMGAAVADVAVPKLVRALHDPDNWVRALAAEALGQIGEPAEEAVPALVASLKHVNPLVRGNAAEALGKMGSAAAKAQSALEKAARDKDGGVRSRAIAALGAIGQPSKPAWQVIQDGLQDADPLVRAAAVQAVGEWGKGEEVVARLLPLLEDANDQVKVAVIGVLPKLAGPAPAIIAGLCRRLQEDDSADVQRAAALALGKLGPAAREAGAALLHAALTAESEVREQAMRAIAIIQPPETTAAFVAGLRDANSETRKVASGGWRNATSIPEEVIPALVEALHDPEIQVRANAAYALARLDAIPDVAVGRLTECATSPDDGLRMNAAMALRLAPADAANAVMQHLLEDGNLRIRLIAAGTLLAREPGNVRAAEVVREGLTASSPPVRKAALELVESLEAGAAFAEVLAQRREVEDDPRVREVLDRLREGVEAPAEAAGR
jgi:HEAT repeat protein